MHKISGMWASTEVWGQFTGGEQYVGENDYINLELQGQDV